MNAKTGELNDAYIASLDEYIGTQIAIANKDAIPVLAVVKKEKWML